MGFRMIEPWKNPRSKFLWFRKRVPERFVALMGRREIKFSLGITDPDDAQLLCVEENLKLERMWQNHAAGRPPGRELDYRQIVALAGEFYKETVEKHRRNPGKAADWESSIARDRTLRQLRSFPLKDTKTRIVPLHPHLIEQDFLKYVGSRREPECTEIAVDGGDL
jgi:hypothetical protein